MVALVKRNGEGVLTLEPWFRPLDWLDEFEAMARAAFEPGLSPSLDMFEDGKDLVIKAEMPGIRKKDLEVSLDGDVLTITAEKKAEERSGDAPHYTRERRFGRYVRRMTLPTRVDAENVTATLKKGLLEIRLPEAAWPESKRIEIKTK